VKGKKYYVCNCSCCNHQTLLVVDTLECDDECCLDFNKMSVIKEFNSENEAKVFMGLKK